MHQIVNDPATDAELETVARLTQDESISTAPETLEEIDRFRATPRVLRATETNLRSVLQAFDQEA
jgi:hypothetical protein